MMTIREPLLWHFKQLDIAVGLSFTSNFHFALVGHLLKGYRHPTPTTVTRTARVLTMLLAIVAKPHRRDKFEVTPESVAYLAGKVVQCLLSGQRRPISLFFQALVSVSEEVRSRCHIRHSASRNLAEAESTDQIDILLPSVMVDIPLFRGLASILKHIFLART